MKPDWDISQDIYYNKRIAYSNKQNEKDIIMVRDVKQNKLQSYITLLPFPIEKVSDHIAYVPFLYCKFAKKVIINFASLLNYFILFLKPPEYTVSPKKL